MTKIYVFALALVLGSLSFADVVVIHPVKVSTDLAAWAKHIQTTVEQLKQNNKYSPTGYTECAATIEVPGSFLCFSSEEGLMNKAFGRASLFSEGTAGFHAGNLALLNSQAYQSIISQAAGHDIPSVNLAGFYTALTQACKASNNDPNVCPNDMEKDIFNSFIVPLLKENKNFAVITTSPELYSDVVSHEILHAQYFLNPTYQKIVDDFWAESLSSSWRQTVKSLISDYDTTNEFVMRNEFQAYLLMNSANRYSLGSMVSQFQGPLVKALTDNGVPPVKIQNLSPRFERVKGPTKL